MADPQIENGYTRIANELLEAVCRLNFSGGEMRILLYIIRRTYGFNRSFAEMPLQEIAAAVGMKKVNVSRTLKKLRELNLIDLHPNRGTIPQTISIVKNYEKWAVESCASLPLSKLITVINPDNSTVINSDNPTVINPDNSTVINSDNYTYKEIKESIKERGKKELPPSGKYGNCCLNMSQYDKLVSDFGKGTVDKYIEKVDLYVQSSGRTYIDYEAVIRKWIKDDGADKESDVSKYYEFVNDFDNWNTGG